MSRFYLLSFLFLVSTCPLIAQLEVTWGVPQHEQRKTLLSEMLGSDGTYVYAIRHSYALLGNHNPIIERYKLHDLGMEYSKPLDLHFKNNLKLDNPSVYLCRGNLIVLANYYDREKNSNTLYGQVLDGRCNVTKVWTPLATISADNRNNQGSFITQVSTDSSHLLLVINPPYEEYADEKYTLQLIDKDLNSEWKKEIVLPYKDKFFSLSNFMISDTGDVYMLATVSKDRSVMSRKERRSTPTYYYSALLFDHTSDELKEYKISMDPKFISDVKMAIGPNGDIICSGFYSNKNSNTIIGTFYMRIDRSTKAVTAEGSMDFDHDFVTQFMSERKAQKGRELYDYDLKHLALRDDGGAVLVAEQFYVVLIQTYDPQTKMNSYTYYYYYNDIIVVSINPEGQISWAKKIPKYQVSRNDGGYYSSFAFSVSGNKMYFMFNDNPRNLKYADSKQFKYMNNPKKSVAVLVTMDSKGNQERQAMFNNKDLRIILRPKLFLQMNEHRLVLYGEKGSIYKLADVQISE
jgi:hypothetical protein